MLADVRRPSDHDAPATSLPKQRFHQALGIEKVQSGGLRALVQALRAVDGKRLVSALESKNKRYPATRVFYKITIIMIKNDRRRE
jgi:hypothetical protein